MIWLLTAASIGGVILNNYRRRECFLVWIVTNFTWSLHDLSIGERAQAAMFLVYFFLAIWGYVQWGKKEKGK